MGVIATFQAINTTTKKTGLWISGSLDVCSGILSSQKVAKNRAFCTAHENLIFCVVVFLPSITIMFSKILICALALVAGTSVVEAAKKGVS
jgi:hypothetical protein